MSCFCQTALAPSSDTSRRHWSSTPGSKFIWGRRRSGIGEVMFHLLAWRCKQQRIAQTHSHRPEFGEVDFRHSKGCVLGCSSLSAQTHVPRVPFAGFHLQEWNSSHSHTMLPHVAVLHATLGHLRCRESRTEPVSHSRWEDVVCGAPLEFGSHWASWADSLRMINLRHPGVAATMVRCLVSRTPDISVPLHRVGLFFGSRVSTFLSWKPFPLLSLALWPLSSRARWLFQSSDGSMLHCWLWRNVS